MCWKEEQVRRVDELALQVHTFTMPQGREEHGTVKIGQSLMEPCKNADIPIIQIFQQPFKQEIKLQLQILLLRLVFQDPNRSSNNGSSSKRGNRGGVVINCFVILLSM